MSLTDEINKLKADAEARAAAPPADQPPAEPSAPAEQPITPHADPPPTEHPAPPSRHAILSEVLGRTFETDDDIEQFKTEYTTLTTREAELRKQIEELEGGLDESKLYPNEQFRTLAKLMMAHPGKNPMAVTEMLALDPGKAYIENPVNVLALSLMLDNPEIYPTKAAAEEVIARKHNLVRDEDGKWEVDDTILRDLQTEAKRATTQFDELRKTVPPPAKVDLAATREEKLKAEQQRITTITEASKPLFTKKLPEALKEIDFPVTVKSEDGKETTEIAFSYSIPESFVKSKAVQDAIEVFRADRIRNAAEWTPELEAKTLQETSEYLLGMYMYRNRTNIHKAIVEDTATKMSDEAWLKRHNVRPLRTDGTTHSPTAQQVAEQENLRAAAKRMGISY